MPTRTRRRWLRTFIVGFAAMLAFSAGLTLTGRALDAAGMLTAERDLLIELARRTPVSFSVALWLDIPGNSVMLWPVMIFAAGWAAWARRPLLALSLAAGFLALDPLVLLGWWLWNRPRPDLILGGLADPGGFLHAFPSGHAAQAVFAWGMLAFLWGRATQVRWERTLAAASAAAVTAVVAVARLRVGAHWPSDIVAGLLIGGGWLAIVIAALRTADSPPDTSASP